MIDGYSEVTSTCHDRPGHALLQDGRVATSDRGGRAGQGHGAAAAQVLPEQQGVDLGGRPAQHRGLEVEGDELGLDEVRRREDGRQRQGLHRVVAGVGHEVVGGVAEGAGNGRRIEIRAVARGDAEVPGQVLEPEARQVAGPRVVQLGQEIGVDDVAAGDLVAAIADRPLCDGELRDAAPHGLAAASPRERDAVAPGARLDVLEVEAEDVVSLDHVGIALADEPRALLEEGRLRQAVSAEDVAESRRVGQGDGDDAIARARGAGKLEALGGEDLDVEGQPAQVVEAHAAEGRGSRGEEELVDGVAGEPVGCAAQRGRGRTARRSTSRSAPARPARRVRRVRMTSTSPVGARDGRGVGQQQER